MLSNGPKGREALGFNAVLRAWGAFSFYPQCLPHFKHAIGMLPYPFAEEIKRRKGFTPISTNNYWKHFVKGIDQRCALLESFSRTELDLCDNDFFFTGDNRRNTKPQVCSGCHSVVYCTVECQTTDWKERHRRECKSMRQSYLDRCRNQIRYTPFTRSFHLAVMTSAINDFYFSDIQNSPPRTITLLDFVDNPIPRPKRKTISIKERLESTRDELVFWHCQAMETRALRLMKRLYNQDGPETRLVEGMFCWNSMYRISVVAELALNGAAVELHVVISHPYRWD
ncbi:hypothetical protein CC2G_001699 [Coprinopsis cinerea AmutBmut pab1-1]|nr:hypothetical protein CC2G_001699 [Coprinopsis cinerea AmutBmut pab1-1]